MTAAPLARRGIGGTVAEQAAPSITVSLREAAYGHPEVPNAPARLIAAITETVVGLLGERVREQVAVSLPAVPEGRSGIGGRVA